jgi:DNA-binding transcriptional ArsR family regulator
MDILTWLQKGGYDYTWNIMLGGKIPDIIAFRQGEVVAFEIKKYANEVSTAVGQCLQYLSEANKVYLVLPRKEANIVKKKRSEILEKYGIGLIASNSNPRILIEAKYFPLKSLEMMISRLRSKSITSTTLTPKPAEEVRKKIIDLLKDHPEGLSINDISKKVDVHRHTASKYIFYLEGAGEVIVRKIGVVNLVYKKEAFPE